MECGYVWGCGAPTMAGCSKRGSPYSCLNPWGGKGMLGSDICLWYMGRPSRDIEGEENEWHGSDNCRRNLNKTLNRISITHDVCLSVCLSVCILIISVPVVYGVSAVREGLGRCEVRVRPVWFRGGRHMLARGHWRAAGGRHWAGGLHSRGMLLLVGTGDTREQEQFKLVFLEGLSGYRDYYETVLDFNAGKLKKM